MRKRKEAPFATGERERACVQTQVQQKVVDARLKGQTRRGNRQSQYSLRMERRSSNDDRAVNGEADEERLRFWSRIDSRFISRRLTGRSGVAQMHLLQQKEPHLSSLRFFLSSQTSRASIVMFASFPSSRTHISCSA